jgi:ferredoxin-nitrite reductase
MMMILEKAQETRNKKINKVEKVKELKAPMDVYKRLEEIAISGYELLAQEDSTYFLKCFGLFNKGKDFMLRIRIPAGQLNYEQSIRIGEVAKKYGNDYIDITTRMQIELRYLQISDIANIIKELEEVGLSTFQTGVDNPRNIVSDPLDGIAHDNIIKTMPIIKELQDLFLHNAKWISVLPRKFNTGILGSLSNSCNIFGHDCCFVLAQKNGLFGFNVYLGGRVGVQAKDANIFLQTTEVALFFKSLLTIFKTYGYRDNRNKNRLIYLINDVGMTNFTNAIKKEAGCEFDTAGITLVQSQSTLQETNKILCRDNNFAYKVVVPAGIFSGTDMIEVAKSAKEFANGDIRLSYDQNVYVPHIKKENLSDFESTQIIKKYIKFNNVYFDDMIACAGTKHCSFGVIESKDYAIEIADFLNSQLAIENATIRINWSGCPKGCGVHGIADIGLEGCKTKDDNGKSIDAVHIYIGGQITRLAKEAQILHKSLPIIEAKYHIKYLVENYAKFRLKGETYEDFYDRYLSRNYSFQALKFFTKINYILDVKLDLDIKLELESEPKSFKKESFEIFHFGLKIFKLLTKEKRYMSVDNFEPALIKPRTIHKYEVTKLNAKVPKKLSEVIYLMTHQDKEIRAKVFSELLILLDEIDT